MARTVVCLDGRSRPWKLAGLRVYGDDERRRSKPHLRARAILADVFGGQVVLEEVPIPGSKLRFDFLVPGLDVAVEVQGRQHYHRVQHFHKTALGAAKANGRDEQKRRFCSLNELRLVELPYNEDDDAWRARLRPG